jgi:hypothetical protein
MDNFAQPVQKNIRHNSTELLPLPFRPRCSVGNSLRNHILLNLTACTFGIWRLARSAAQWSQITNLYSRILSSHARLGTSDPQQPKKINTRIYNYIYIHTHSHTHTHSHLLEHFKAGHRFMILRHGLPATLRNRGGQCTAGSARGSSLTAL